MEWFFELLQQPGIVMFFIFSFGAIFLVRISWAKFIQISHPQKQKDKISTEIMNRYCLMAESFYQYEALAAKMEGSSSTNTSGSSYRMTDDFLHHKRKHRSVVEKLIATDVFVEKAKAHLTERAQLSFSIAMVLLSICAAIAYISFFWLSNYAPQLDFEKPLNWGAGPSVYLILRALAMTSIVLAAIYIPAALARSFLNEWAVLMSRRHSLRFGRLASFLFDGEMSVDDLVEVFGWNITPPSSFSGVKPEHVTKGIIGQMVGALDKKNESTKESPKKE